MTRTEINDTPVCSDACVSSVEDVTSEVTTANDVEAACASLAPCDTAFSLSALVDSVTISALGIDTQRCDFTPHEFNLLFNAALSVSKAGNWLLGDTLNLADRQWGNQSTGSKYADAAAATGLSIGSIKNISLTCKAIPFERRRPELSFTHHMEARSYSSDSARQDEILDTALEKKLSIKDMRKAIRQDSASPDSSSAPASEENDDMPFGIIGLPERAAPDAPPMWDALRFVAWAEKQDPEEYDEEQCSQAITLIEPLLAYHKLVLERQAVLQEDASQEA